MRQRYWRPNQAFLGPVKRGGKAKTKPEDAVKDEPEVATEIGSEESPASTNNETTENTTDDSTPKVPVMTRKAGRRVHFQIEVINAPIKNIPPVNAISEGVTVYDRSSNSLIFSIAPRTVGRSQVVLDRIPFSFRFGRR